MVFILPFQSQNYKCMQDILFTLVAIFFKLQGVGSAQIKDVCSDTSKLELLETSWFF